MRLVPRCSSSCWLQSITLRVHVPNNWVLRVLVIVIVAVIVVQVLGKYMITRYLDP